MEIQAGAVEILETGTVITFNAEPLKYCVAEGLTVKLTFRDDFKDRSHRM